MSELFILQNHDKLFLGRQKEWLDGRDPASLFKTPHKDEAVNQVFEISSKDYTQRIKVVSCKVNEKGLPIIDAELLGDAQPASAPLFASEAPEEASEADESALREDAASDADDLVEDIVSGAEDSAEEDLLHESDEAEAEGNQPSLL